MRCSTICTRCSRCGTCLGSDRRPPLAEREYPLLDCRMGGQGGHQPREWWSVGEAPSAHAPLRCSRGRAWRTRGMRASLLPARAWHAFLRCLARAALARALHALRCTTDACCTCCSAQLNACGREGTWHARAARSQEHVTAARDALHRHARGVGHAKDGPAQRSRDCFVRVSGEHRRADGCRQAHDTGQHPVGLCPVVPENPFSYRHC
jgi:hypothetical protein